MRGLFLLAMLFFAQTFVSAQGNLKIRGTVSDIDGKPIELAVVKVEGQGAGTLTDLNGKYSFTCQSGDSVVVVFSMLGYQTHKRTLMSPHDSVTLKVVLKPSDHIGTGNGERATGSVEHHAKHKGKGHKKSAEHYGQRRRGFDFHNGGSEQARRDEFAIQCAWRFV